MSTTKTENPRISRLNMRLTPEAHDLLRSAAAVDHQDVSSFVLGAALSKARQVMFEESVLTLSAEDMSQLQEALNKPGEPNSALADLFQKAQ